MLLIFLGGRKKTTAAAIVLILLTVAIVWCTVTLTRKTFYQGIYIENIDVSGMRKPEAKEIIESQIIDKYSGQNIVLKSGNNKWETTLKSISFRLLIDDTLDAAYKIGRTGSIFKRLYEVIKLRTNNVYLTAKPDFDRNRLVKLLINIKKQIDQEPKSASIKFENGKIVIDKEITGLELDIEANLKLIENCILLRNFQQLNLQTIEKKPKILYDEIKEIKYELSSFFTKFNTGDVNRSHNIKLACERINGKILMPGEILSMNMELGPRTLENGFKEAPVILKDELVQGTGGGICQVTTTLYVAVLKSLLEVVERTPHSMPLTYVSAGQDATIAEGTIDFKFRNKKVYGNLDNDYPVCIYAGVEGNKIIVKIFGRDYNKDYIVKLKSEILEAYEDNDVEYIIDDSIPDGEQLVLRKPRKGLKVVVYREVYSINGELLDREEVSRDVYKPVKAQIKVNSNYFIQARRFIN
jgi:vancomycin resistance protein YoaR